MSQWLFEIYPAFERSHKEDAGSLKINFVTKSLK